MQNIYFAKLQLQKKYDLHYRGTISNFGNFFGYQLKNSQLADLQLAGSHFRIALKFGWSYLQEIYNDVLCFIVIVIC